MICVADGKLPKDFSGDSLTHSTVRAAAEIASLYSGQSRMAAAELHFAIYPWSGQAGSVIMDIDSDSDGYIARDIQGTATAVRGKSLEDPVSGAERVLADPTEAMFGWIRKISTLQPSS